MIDLRTAIDLLSIEANKKLLIINEDGTPLEYGVDDISVELDSKVTEIFIHKDFVEIDLDY